MHKEDIESLATAFQPFAAKAVLALTDQIIIAAQEAFEKQKEKEKPGTPWLKIGLTLNVNVNDPTDYSIDGSVGVTYKVHVSPHDAADDTPELEEGMGKSESPRKKRGKIIGVTFKADD